jgi:hypothetical protein
MIQDETLTHHFLSELGKHLKVEVVDTSVDKWLYDIHGSPFQTFHSGEKFFIAKEYVKWAVLVHEYAHLVAWIVSGQSGHDQFGCAGASITIQEDLEYDTCCIEMFLRQSIAHQSLEEIEKILLKDYDFEYSLEWIDEIGHVGQEKFVADAIAHGEDLFKKMKR